MYKLKSIGFPWEEFHLTTGAYRLGSSSDNEIVIEDSSVAKHHCEIVVTGKSISIRDLSPDHQTFVDEQQTQSTSLALGQTLRLGNIKLVLEGEAVAAAAVEAGAGEQAPAATTPTPKPARPARDSATGLVLVLLGLLGVGVLAFTLWDSRDRDSRTSKADRSADSGSQKNASKSRKKDEPGAEKSSADNSSKSKTSDKTDGNPQEDRETDDADSTAGKFGTNRVPREIVEDAKRPFNPKDKDRPPSVDYSVAEYHMMTKDYAHAEPYLDRALRNQKRDLGPDHPDVTKSLDALGRLYRNSSQFAKAEPLLQQALKNVQSNRTPNDKEAASALNNLGELYLASGDLAKAAPLLSRALDVRENKLKNEDRDLAVSLSNMAALKAAQGDPAKAKPIMERALKVFEAVGATNDPVVAQTLKNLGDLNRASGDNEKAEPLLQRALDLQQKQTPPDDSALRETLKSLADTHAAKGEFAKAEPLYQRAREITEKKFGAEHPNTADSLKSLAKLHQKAGDPTKAAPLLQQAEKIDEAALGPEHPRTVEDLTSLAELHNCQGDQSLAPQAAKQAVQAKLKLLASLVWYGSEQQRLAGRNLANPSSLAATLTDTAELAQAILRHKGTIVDSLLEERILDQVSRTPETRVQVEKLRAAKSELAQFAFEIPKDFSPQAQQSRQVEMKTLATYVKALEEDLEHRVPGFGRSYRGLGVTVDEVKWAIPGNAALVEWVRYSRCRANDDWEPCYGAVVLAANGNPKWISLGSAEAIEKNITSYQDDMAGIAAGQPAQATENNQDPKEQSYAALLRNLYQQLWTPIEPLLPASTKTIIVSPDGALNLVSFATLLMPDDRVLAQKYSFRYVSSGRDLLAEKRSPQKGAVLIFGNPDFAALDSSKAKSESSSTAIPETDRSDLQALRFPKTSTGAQEVALLELQARKWDSPASLYFGASASESRLASIARPQILHLATYAFCLPGPTDNGNSKSMSDAGQIASSQGQKFVDGGGDAGFMPNLVNLIPGTAALKNPIYRNGAALAGAAATFKIWERGDTIPPNDDGVLTAAEMATLPLSKTDLVVMSGGTLGSATGGSADGTLALRRALIQAGAANTLIALRPEGDEDTAKVMTDFYTKFHVATNVPQAFDDVQREWLVRLRKERGLRSAVRTAGSFVMNSQGPVQ